MDEELNSLGLEIPPSVPESGEEEEAPDGGLPGRVSKIEGKVSGHEKDIFTLKAIQTGILVVVAVGFVAIVISLIIFFCETTGRLSDKVDSFSGYVEMYKIERQTAQIDSLKIEIQKLNHSTSILHPPSSTAP